MSICGEVIKFDNSTHLHRSLNSFQFSLSEVGLISSHLWVKVLKFKNPEI